MDYIFVLWLGIFTAIFWYIFKKIIPARNRFLWVICIWVLAVIGVFILPQSDLIAAIFGGSIVASANTLRSNG